MARIVTVFGGTGFLGRRIVRNLYDHGSIVRIASRHRDRAARLFAGDDPRLQPIQADIHEEASLGSALAGTHAVVNAVSLYVEHGRETFRSVHVIAAGRLASRARQAGVERFVHVSGIGADPASPSPYISSRGSGEQAVRTAFPGAVLIRPAVMFGPGDAFLTTILALLRRLPVYPMFGQGRTKLQPAYVEDVAEAAALVLDRDDAATFECAGPHVYRYVQLLRIIARAADINPVLVPMPFAAWRVVGWGAELLPTPPITRSQVELMEADSVASPGMPGFQELRISPTALETVLNAMLTAKPETN